MFTQEMRWSPGAMWAVGGLLLFVMAALLAPALVRPPDDRETALALVLGVAITTLSGGLVWTFTTLRVTVDDQALTVGFGPFRERLPLERIVECGPTTYRWYEWGGWGIRLGWRAKLYNVPGDRGVAVQVVLDDGRRVLFSSPDPEAVCQVLRERRPGIRIAQAAGT
jgi:hypothetical protein